jgi:hypothetical protein
MKRVQYYPTRPTVTIRSNVGHEIRERWHLLAGLLDRLLQRNGDIEPYFDDLNAAQLLLESLPLASEPFGVAMSRLRNARRYLESSETGAARYELRLLASALKNALAE